MGSWGSSARCYHRHPLDTVQDPRELIEAYYSAGWTDGLPVVPPSGASIEEMLAAGGLRGDEVIGEVAGRSTGGSAMVLVVNGPVARRLAINSGNNAFGQGHRPNATIGRAVRLIMMNVMNTRPGLLDRATFGNPGKYSFCFAEHEDDPPWEPLHVARGLRAEDSAVTVYASNSLYQVYNQLAAAPEPLLLGFADALCNLGVPNVKGFNQA